jgi:hypothetical protein
MSRKTKGRGQTEFSPRSSKLSFGLVAEDPIPEEFNVK